MYSIYTANSKIEKRLEEYIKLRLDINNKLDRLKLEPRRANSAHPLHGKLEGKWSCWLGSNIRLIYYIDDVNKMIIITAIGTHRLY